MTAEPPEYPATAPKAAEQGARRQRGGHRPPRRKRKSGGFLLFLFLNLAIALVLTGIGAAWVLLSLERPGPHAEDRRVIVPRGASLDATTDMLAQAGVLSETTMFRLRARLTGDASRIRAGEYLVPARASVEEVLEILVEGKTVVRKLTIAEGLTSAEIVGLLMAAEGLVGEITALPPEGTLLPETYHYSWGDGREAMLARMEEGMRTAIAELWAKRNPGLPLETPAQAVTLASIVEKETGIAEERRRVAAVFVNRLRKNIRLQSDPTVIYGVTNGRGPLGREISKADLAAVNPYNTYVIDGLPPGPIANPGKASLAAALNPIASDEIYFVADGTGGHVFARTLEEHLRNVRRWRQIEKTQ